MTTPPHDDEPANIGDGPDEEKVGYKRPPRRSQFKPGQSGNPRGRKKGAAGLKKILQDELTSSITLDVGPLGSPKLMSFSKLQVIVKRLVEKALNGNQRAIEQLITLNITMFGLGEDDTSGESQLTPGEQAYLEALSQRSTSGDAEAGHKADPSAVAGGEEGDDG